MCGECGCGDGVEIEAGGRRVAIGRDLLAADADRAAANRARLTRARAATFNLLSGPGAGKTTLLERTLRHFAGRLPLGVIEGDQRTSADAERIRATGVEAVQINTGKGCHLDAAMVARALGRMEPPGGGLLFIENVGNLVCTAAFDLGQHLNVAILSTAEGEEKPLKYPDLFAIADLLLITKCDLLPHLDFDCRRAIDNARRLRPGLEAIELSARSGEGLERWFAWLERARARLFGEG